MQRVQRAASAGITTGRMKQDQQTWKQETCASTEGLAATHRKPLGVSGVLVRMGSRGRRGGVSINHAL